MLNAHSFAPKASGAYRPLALGARKIQPSIEPAATCAVRLVDRRTGAVHRVNGMPVVIYTLYPSEAVASLLAGRDPKIWDAQVAQLGR